ncbi:hypothetical protein F5Y07DRAFT_411212 [Xylaria sp. FL0933]|nr:hypothetical protein F5Y07DRAFT_411212 [Xylaria sp. FL0933]
MQRTPPPTLPRRPVPAGKPYKTLPDASKAALPPKPLITPMSLSPSQLPRQRAMLTPDPSPQSKPIYSGQKRRYSHFNDYVVFPLQTSPTPKRSRHAYEHNHTRMYDGAGEFEGAKHIGKTLAKSPDITSAHSKGTYNNYEMRNTMQINEKTSGKGANIKTVHQKGPCTRKQDPAVLDVQLIHNKLLGGATTLTKTDQGYLQHQMSSNPTIVPPLMVNLVITRVTNKTPDLSYGIMQWANVRKQPQILESVLTDWLYNFDVQEAFNEPLMSVQQVANLMDCQIVLECVRSDRIKQEKKTKIERADINIDVDAGYESDARSLSMDLSDTD